MKILRLLFILAIATTALGSSPNPTILTFDSNQKRGFSENNVFQFGDLDHVNLFNGNVAVTIPIGPTYQAGPMLQYQLMLTYNSKIWDYAINETIQVDCTDTGAKCALRYGVPEPTSTAGFGWTLSLGRLLNPRLEEPKRGWTYIGPDGAEHGFEQILTPDPAPQSPFDIVRARTADSSYLELRRDVPAWPEIWFPDGHVEKFDSEGRLVEMRDRYGNWVRIDYSDSTKWVITDGYGGYAPVRTHYVHLLDKSGVYDADRPNFRSLVSLVDLAAFDNTPEYPNSGDERAHYQFAYADHWTGRGGGGKREGSNPSKCITAPFLDSVTLPDGTTYELSYKVIDGAVPGPEPSPPCVATAADLNGVLDSDSGIIQSMKLPTGGKIEWTHGLYVMNQPECQNGVGFAAPFVGVRARTFKDRNGVELMKWTYTPTLVPSGVMGPLTCEGQYGIIPLPAKEFYNDVDIWSGPPGAGGSRKLRTRSYFSAYPSGAYGPSGSDSYFKGSEYGRPFTRNGLLGSSAAGDLRLLSGEVSDCTSTCDVLRRSYVLYDEDTVSGPGFTKANNRVIAERSVDLKASGCSGGNCYTDTQRSEWDGFGHYKRSVSTSNLPGTPKKTTYTNYTPDATNWLLNLYTTSWVKHEPQAFTLGGAAPVASKSIAVFDSTYGVMTSVRTLRATGPDLNSLLTGSDDLFTAWCRDPRGFVISERYFGGDGGSIPSVPCIEPRTPGNYYVNHEYTFDGAALTKHQAKYDGTSHWISDSDLDRNTGLARTSRDSAGVETKFSFDKSGRPTAVRPHGRAATIYTYTPTAYSPTIQPAQITVAQECPAGAGASPCNADLLTESRHFYDDLGRLSQSATHFGAGATDWASVWTTYDGAGRKKAVSVPTQTGGTAIAQPAGTPVTTWTYDVLGRPLSETRPDLSASTWAYRGGRETDRFVGGVLRSTEEFNGVGQLVAVRQRAEPTEGEIVTSYGYDAGDRLTSVRMTAPTGSVQERVFDYDGRGFLRWESQPESGMASYTYDSRGHLLTKNQSAANSQFDLKYAYDAAERLLTLSSRNPNYGEVGEPEFRVMKDFTYGTDNGTGDLRKGKLVRAARYNYPTPNFVSQYWETVKVEDTYQYGDASGRKTLRTTTLSDGDGWVYKSIDTGVFYNALDLPVYINYPTCWGCGMPDAAPDRSTTTYAYQRGRLESIAGFVSDISYWPNGLRNELVRTNDRIDKQVVGNMPRPSSISFIPTPVERCQRPAFVTQPANATLPGGGGSVTLSVVPGGTGPFEYKWIRESNDETVGTTQSITVTVTATDEFYVVVNNSCGYEESQAAKITVGGSCAGPTIHGIAKLRQRDGTYLLKPDISAQSQRQYSWVRLSDFAQIATTETVIVPAPVSDATYRFTLSDSCNIPTTQDVTLSDTPTITKTGLVATAAAGSAQVTIAWPASSDVDYYVLQRRSGAAWQEIATNLTGTSSVTYVDNGVVANKTYAYRAYAVRETKTSDFSNADVATTRSFLQAIAGQAITPAPFNEMLAAVNSVRAAAGWGPVTWSNILASTDPLPLPSKSIVERHLTSARYRMNEALSALGSLLPVYAKKIVAGAPIAAADVNEVQQRAQ